MKFIKLTFSYLKKNFLYMFLLSIIPTIYFGFLLRPFSLFEFVNAYPTMIVNNFGTIFDFLFDVSVLNIFLTILGIIVLSTFVSIAVGQIQNHMRSGKVNLKNCPSYLNDNFIVSLVNILIMFAIWLLLRFIFSGIICSIHIIFLGMNSQPNIALEIVAIILASITFILFIQISAIFTLNIPNMLINGYPAKQAFSNSIKLLNANNFKFLISLILPFLVIIPLCSLLFNVSTLITNFIGVWILCMYVPVLTITTYFELTNTTRYDNRQYFNYNN